MIWYFREVLRSAAALMIVFVSSFLLLDQTRAQTYFSSDRAWSDAGGWQVYRSPLWGGGCFGERRDGDGTVFVIGRVKENNWFLLGVGNDRMDFVKPNQKVDLVLLFDRAQRWTSTLTGFQNEGKTLLLGAFDGGGKFQKHFSQFARLRLSLGGKPLANLSLNGNGAVLKAVEACFASLSAPSPSPAAASIDDSGTIDDADKLELKAISLYEQGQYGNAEPNYRRALAIREKRLGPNAALVAQSLNNLAAGLAALGKRAEAETHNRRALAIREKLNGRDSLEVAETSNNLAALLYDGGDFATSVKLNRRVLDIRSKVLGAEHRLVASSLNNLANAVKAQGDAIEAEALYRRSIVIGEKVHGRDHIKVAESLNNLANLLFRKGDLEAAGAMHRRALAIRRTKLGSGHADVAASLHNLGSVFWKQRNYAEAQKNYREALEIREKAFGRNHALVADSINGLAVAFAEAGDYNSAEPLYRQALEIQKKLFGTKHRFVAATENNLANLLRSKGDTAGALPRHRTALAIRQRTLGPKHPDVALSYNNIANALADAGDHFGALDNARLAAAIGWPRRGTYLGALTRAKPGNAALMAESFQVVQNTAGSSSGAALQSLATRFSAGNSALAQMVRQEQDKSVEVERLNQAILAELSRENEKRNAAHEANLRQRIVTVVEDLDALRTELRRQFPDYAELSRPSPLALHDAQALLAEDEALIVLDIAPDKDGYDYVWAISRRSAAWRQLETKQGQVGAAVAKMRGHLDLEAKGRAPLDPGAAHDLYRQLLGPVEHIISNKPHLLFVLNGALSSLPPHVLVTEPPRTNDLRAAAWLVRRHAITILPSVNSLKLLRSQAETARPAKSFVGFGDPVFDPAREGSGTRSASRSYNAYFRGSRANLDILRAGFARLPGTAREIRAVARALGAPESDVILREKASEATIKQSSLDQYNIVYFATHGLVAGEVARAVERGAEPALAFTIPATASDLDDGLLTASEIAQLKLNADWIVMSACNTAAGGRPGADALSGLARAFFYAGARSLLVSHWVVDDDATTELMTRVFALTAKSPGSRAADALRGAMISVMDDPKHTEWRDPVFWAPFVIVGEPRRGG